MTAACGERESTNPPPPEDNTVLAEPENFSNPPAPESVEPVETTDGEDIFASSCSGCHGADGDSGSAPQLSVMVPTLDDDELVQIIEDGTGSMPGGLVSSDDLQTLISYLRETFP